MMVLQPKHNQSYTFFKTTGLSIITLFFLVCIVPLQATASESDIESNRKQQQQRIRKKIQEEQIKIQRLQSGLESQKEGVEKSAQKEKGILAEIEEIDTRLNTMGLRLTELKKQMKSQQKLIAKKEEELIAVNEKSIKVQHHMQKRISAYYKLGRIDLVNITFSTQTMPDLLRFHDAFQTVIEYDHQVMADYHTTIKELESAKESLTLEKGLLEEFIAQTESKKINIRDARKEKTNLLHKIRTQAELHRQAAKEIQEATQNLAQSLLSMKKEEKFYDQGFLVNKGNHIPPMKGKVTSLFNEERVNGFGISRKTPGISLDAPDGTKIVSIYPGKVIYTGYLKGYGNSVIIDHGYQYFTITSRIERILVAKGANVKRNDIIGIMGSTATILDKGLYFEIRQNDEPVDPLEWLNKKKMRLAKRTQ